MVRDFKLFLAQPSEQLAKQDAKRKCDARAKAQQKLEKGLELTEVAS